MATRSPLAVGEWYHCYTRGVDKRIVFEDERDFDRFLSHLFVSNGTKNVRVSDITDTRLLSILANPPERGEPLVEIGAYALMPNHLHLLIKEIRDGGIGNFMQKVFTGYTKYFNNRRGRTGALFASTFKSKHISDDIYLKQALPYVLLNPIELFESRWKSGTIPTQSVEKKMLAYPYSSLPDFMNIQRAERALVGESIFEYYDKIPTLSAMLESAREYYAEHAPQV